MTQFEYETHYLGEDTRPSYGIWRINKETGERHLRVALGGGGLNNLDEARKTWAEIQDATSNASEPSWWMWRTDDNRARFGMAYWWKFESEEAEASALAAHRQANPHFTVSDSFHHGNVLH